ncbi:MAG: hypothetical protein QG615_463, partial [Nitrospirota bacterium]|nr:hypothetical protein [Nitrospirota bacterium]
MSRPLQRWCRVVRECRSADRQRVGNRSMRLRFHPTGPTPSARV